MPFQLITTGQVADALAETVRYGLFKNCTCPYDRQNEEQFDQSDCLILARQNASVIRIGVDVLIRSEESSIRQWQWILYELEGLENPTEQIENRILYYKNAIATAERNVKDFKQDGNSEMYQCWRLFKRHHPKSKIEESFVCRYYEIDG